MTVVPCLPAGGDTELRIKALLQRGLEHRAFDLFL